MRGPVWALTRGLARDAAAPAGSCGGVGIVADRFGGRGGGVLRVWGRVVTNRFVWISWNRHKRVYDAVLCVSMVVYLIAFVVGSFVIGADTPDVMVVLIRATGTLGLVMLHVILCVGPLSRFTDLLAPVLYNRRHFGVAMFCVGLVHAGLVLVYYGGFGNTDPVSAVLLGGRSFGPGFVGSVGSFPYELLGFCGLVILFVMAATSHDFWLDLLGAGVWKWIHMLVYAAYALLVGHVALGVLADSTGAGGSGFGGVWVWLLGGGVVIVATLHLLAGLRELTRDEMGATPIEVDSAVPDRVGWIEVGTVDEIPEGRAKVVSLGAGVGGVGGGDVDGALRGERVAVFRHKGTVTAMTNVCAHQGGPLGEGRIVDGCVTCPWHGYQFEADSGRSPPPYTEKVATYRLRVEGRRVYLDPRALAPGTRVDPVFFEASPADEKLFEDVEVDRLDSSIDRSVDLLPGEVRGGVAADASEAGPERDGERDGEPPVGTGF